MASVSFNRDLDAWAHFIKDFELSSITTALFNNAPKFSSFTIEDIHLTADLKS